MKTLQILEQSDRLSGLSDRQKLETLCQYVDATGMASFLPKFLNTQVSTPAAPATPAAVVDDEEIVFDAKMPYSTESESSLVSRALAEADETDDYEDDDYEDDDYEDDDYEGDDDSYDDDADDDEDDDDAGELVEAAEEHDDFGNPLN